MKQQVCSATQGYIDTCWEKLESHYQIVRVAMCSNPVSNLKIPNGGEPYIRKNPPSEFALNYCQQTENSTMTSFTL